MNRKKGFTLLEIIATITLLIVISSMAIPAYTHIVESQKKKADMATALHLAELAKTYYIEKKDTDSTNLKKYITTYYGEMPKSKSNDSEFIVTLSSGKASVKDGTTEFIKDGVQVKEEQE